MFLRLRGYKTLYLNSYQLSTSLSSQFVHKKGSNSHKGIPLPRCSDRSPETPHKFAAPPDVEKCHFRATLIWIVGKFRDFKTFNNISHVGYQTKALDVRNHKNVFIRHLGSHIDHTYRPHLSTTPIFDAASRRIIIIPK